MEIANHEFAPDAPNSFTCSVCKLVRDHQIHKQPAKPVIRGTARPTKTG